MEYMACTGVLCTAVIIDALLNGPTDDLPEEALRWLREHRELKVAPLVGGAIAGIDRVLEDGSEMNQLWIENEDLHPEWEKSVLDLRGRLQRVSASRER